VGPTAHAEIAVMQAVTAAAATATADGRTPRNLRAPPGRNFGMPKF
jgi:hypothetical protein